MYPRIRVSSIIISGNQILLIHRRKKGKEYWVFPGGGVEEGESHEQAMKREIEEETGLKTTDIRFAFDDPVKWDNGENFFYYCDVKYATPILSGPEKVKLSPDNWFQPEWVELLKINNMEIYPEEGKKRLLNLS